MTKTLIYAIALNADEYEKDLTFYDAGCGDYIYYALFDLEGDCCIYHEDNIHGYPDEFLNGLVAGVELTGNDLKIIEALIVLNEGELDSNFIDVCAAIRRYIKENNL